MNKDTVELATQMVFEHVQYGADTDTVASDTMDTFAAVGEPVYCTYDELVEAMYKVNTLRLGGKNYQECIEHFCG